MNSRVKWFESLVDEWGPDCAHARTACQVPDHEVGKKVPWVATFNIPLLESIASGHFFDRSFAPANEDVENVRRDNKRCLQLLDQWKSKFPANYKNANVKLVKKGEGLTQDFLNRPRTAVLGPGRFERHPDLHPTAYKPIDPIDIRLILPVKGILPMGSAKGVVGYGVIHPNLINAAVLQTYGLSSLQGHFDAMSLAPNFDLSLTQQEAAEIAARIAEWSTEEINLEGQGELIVQTPFEPSKENMKHHRHFIDPTMRSGAQGLSIAQVSNVMNMTDELSWLIPPMGAILQKQGTKTRALYYHLLQCKEDNTREPQLNEETIQRIIDTVINDAWLQLESDEDLKAVKDGTQSLKTVLDSKTATERDIFLWNYAGVLIQTGAWRRFHSLEEMYVLLASFWGMKAPKGIPTCTTWPTFQDEGIRVQLDNHRQHKQYLISLRRSISPSRRGPRSETSAPRTPIQTPKPPPTLDDLVAISDPTWNPDLHRGLDYLWAIMQVPEREAFLKGLATHRESTSMSAMVQISPEDSPPAVEPTQPPPTQEEPEQSAESNAMEGPQENSGDAPVVSSDQPDPEGVKKESDSVTEEDAQTGGDVAATDQVSQVATAGSVVGDAEPVAGPPQTQARRNNLTRYTIGNLGLDSFVDIFNVLCATASRYVDSEGTFVRKLGLSEQPPHMREILGDYDPVIVFVDSEIEEAIRTMAGDLSALNQRYPSQHGIDWITFQYHLSLMQRDAPRVWHAPGFRMGGRIPLSVGNLCQNHMAHDEFRHCHTTPIRDWQRVRHMGTLKRDPAMRENYVHDAIGALVHYNKIAMEASRQLEAMTMDDMMMVEYDDWSSQLEPLSEAIRTGAGAAAIPDPHMEDRERQAREAEAELIQSIEDENEARARRGQKRREKKERRFHSITQPPAPTVVILDDHAPCESSTDGEGETVTRRLDFDGGSQAISARDPDTPEELHQQPNQPSSPRGTSPPLDLEDTGNDLGPQPVDVDAPERTEEQNQPTEGDGQAEQEPEQPPPEGDQSAGDGEQHTGGGLNSTGQPPDPPDPPEPPEDPDDPGQLPDQEGDE